MLVQVYTIRDVQAKRAILPIYRENEDIAKRDFEMIIAGQKPYCDNPMDYVLYHIGTWDDESMRQTEQDPVRIYDGLVAYNERQVRQEKIADLHKQIDLLKEESD